jgi:hypothetical protein
MYLLTGRKNVRSDVSVFSGDNQINTIFIVTDVTGAMAKSIRNVYPARRSHYVLDFRPQRLIPMVPKSSALEGLGTPSKMLCRCRISTFSNPDC